MPELVKQMQSIRHAYHLQHIGSVHIICEDEQSLPHCSSVTLLFACHMFCHWSTEWLSMSAVLSRKAEQVVFTPSCSAALCCSIFNPCCSIFNPCCSIFNPCCSIFNPCCSICNPRCCKLSCAQAHQCKLWHASVCLCLTWSHTRRCLSMLM